MKFKKDPDAILDYLVDFAAKTNGRGSEDYLQTAELITLASAVSSVPTELVVVSSSITDSGKSVTIWLSGGTVGTVYSVSTRITTSLGRVDERTFQVQVLQR